MEDLSALHFNSRLLVLEMQHRDITVSLIPETTIIRAEYQSHTELIHDLDTSLMPSSLLYILENKWISKKLLESIDIPVAEGKPFQTTDGEKALEYAEKIGFPVVIKPVNGTHGYLVRMNIDGAEEFHDEFSRLAMESHNEQEILVEKQIDGGEFRLSVTKNGFFAAVHRPYPSVTGDGVSTIQSLVHQENTIRAEHKDCRCRIWLDREAKRYLAKTGKNIGYIPMSGEKVYVRSNSNVATGGGCIDVTERVHPEYKALAFLILEQIPGLPYLGLDLIAPDIHSKPQTGTFIVCELNPSMGISLHTHPESGEPRNITAAIIDLLFPETVPH